MSYTQLNADVFTAAFSGAAAGMGVSGRVITDGDQSRYSGLIQIADAFAQEFDTLWGGTAIGFLELEIIFLATEALWQDRAPIVSEVTLAPDTWRTECEAIIALVQEGLDFYAANGYTNPSLGGGGGTITPLSTVRYVDPATTTSSPDGSIAHPFTNLQDAFDSGSGFLTILVVPTGDAGTLNVTAGTVSQLSIVGIVGEDVTTSSDLNIGLITVADDFDSIIGLENVAVTDGVSAPDAVFQLDMSNCQVNGNIDTPNATLVRLTNCLTIGVNINAQNISAESTRANGGGVWTGPSGESDGLIELDGTTNYFQTNNGTTFSVTPTITELIPVILNNLSNVRYVDPNSTVTTHDGSINNPYLTIQEAFDDVSVFGRDITLYLTSRDTVGPLVIPASFDEVVSIIGMCGSALSRETDSVSQGFGLGGVVDSITCEEDAGGNLGVNIQNVTVLGDFLAVSEGGTANPVKLMMTDSSCLNINIPSGTMFAKFTTVRDINCDNFTLYDLQINSLGSAPTLNAANGGKLDYNSYERYAELSVVLPDDTFVDGAAGSAILTVTVPTLAAGVLGYANVNTSGTLLGTLDVRDIVSCNPVNDLAAAGAGNGGFINCRVSAANTIRLAFIGALAGGGSSFLFAKDGRYIPPPS